MSSEAKKRGLDKTPRFEEAFKFYKMQILTQELQRNIQEQAAKVSPEDIAEYYKKNPEAYEQYSVERLFVPRTKQVENEPKAEKEQANEKPTEEQLKAEQEEQKAKQASAEQEMTKLAEDLRGRAAAGEDFMKLQKEAFAAAGMKIDSPTVSLPKIRRTGLPPGHAAVFDLKVGEVSQVINDSGGHYVYKVTSKEQLSLDQVKDEIHNVAQNQRTRDMMDKVNNSFKVETNEAYFGPGGLGGSTPPSPRMPNPRPMPAPTAPAAKPQAPPANKPPAQSPDATPK
jgi:parvulin-like peptidyl-prolyl isomerase